MDHPEKMSLVQLRKLAKEMQISAVTTYKKQELLDLMMKKTKEQALAGEKREASQEKRMPAREKREASQEKRMPAREKRETSQEKRMPAREKREASQEKRMPAREKREASQKKRMPARAKNNHIVTETYSKNQAAKTTQNVKQKKIEHFSKTVGKHIEKNDLKKNDRRRTAETTQSGVPVSVPAGASSNVQTALHAGTSSDGRLFTTSKDGIPGSAVSAQQGIDEASSRLSSQSSQNKDTTMQESHHEEKQGILEIMTEGFGFIRCDNFLPGENDVYVSPALIRRFSLRTGDIIAGLTRRKKVNEKFNALLYINTINDMSVNQILRRTKFENMTPVFPNERIRLEVPSQTNIAMRMVDLISPIGKGQRGMIVSQPKTGKTTLLKQVAESVKINNPQMHLIVLLIDERPEEVTDIKECVEGPNAEVIYSTFDELPENHKRVSEMVIERAKRLVEQKQDVMILLDSITRLARAYNLTVQPSGRTLSGGLDPAALHMPKRFFGAARNMREGGSLTILATALVDTGSKMDDVVFEEFKGTGNMELVLDRSLSEKRLFPAIDLPKSSTRRDDLLLTQEEIEANFLIRRAFRGAKSEEAVENIIRMFRQTKNNQELIQLVKKVKIVP